jgi:hypothetical protein
VSAKISCLMLINQMSGFVGQHTRFCAGQNGRRCEADATAHACFRADDHLMACLNVCDKCARCLEKRGAEIGQPVFKEAWES